MDNGLEVEIVNRLDSATFVQNVVSHGVSASVSGKALAAGFRGTYRRLAPCRSQKVALSD